VSGSIQRAGRYLLDTNAAIAGRSTGPNVGLCSMMHGRKSEEKLSRT